MPIIVKKWGNSAGIRIPASVLEAAKITLGQPVEVRAEGGRIVIELVRAGYDLNALIAGITPENRHGDQIPAQHFGGRDSAPGFA
ncbi:MAG: AbrB/MazE/SpoVT family DNA-binding domain-containing protein [Gammaproteobacteria bacterium]